MRNKVKESPPQSTPYSHAEWAHSNLANFREFDDARHRSQEVRYAHTHIPMTIPTI